MKLATLIAAAILATTAAQAQSARRHFIQQPDGQIILSTDRCASGKGLEATFIESRQGGGGAFGCWVIWKDRVYVSWNTLLGNKGSILRGASDVISYPAPEALIDRNSVP